MLLYGLSFALWECMRNVAGGGDAYKLIGSKVDFIIKQLIDLDF